MAQQSHHRPWRQAHHIVRLYQTVWLHEVEVMLAMGTARVLLDHHSTADSETLADTPGHALHVLSRLALMLAMMLIDIEAHVNCQVVAGWRNLVEQTPGLA